MFCLITCLSLVQAAARHSKRQLIQPAAQPIDVHNAHVFIAHGTSDLRGPCPAMNASTNTNLPEAVNAVVQVYGTGEFPSSGQVFVKRHVTAAFVQVLILLWALPPLGSYKPVMVITSPLAVHQERAFLSLAVFWAGHEVSLIPTTALRRM